MNVSQLAQGWFGKVQRATASFGVKHNLVASIVGRLWSGFMALAFVPLYIHFLGIESYGLIGLFALVMALLSVLDMGLGTTLAREMARLTAKRGTAQQARDLVRTLEAFYWAMGLLIGASICLLAPLIARYWVKANVVPPATVQHALMIMGVVIACEWPLSLYSGGLAGLQRHTLLNSIRVVVSTVEYGGAALVLWLVDPSIEAFFVWQVVAGVLQTLLMGACLWGLLPAAPQPVAVRPRLLATLWRFSVGLTGISVLAAILTQLDKLILSRLLPLDLFGYYALAATISSTLSYAVSPVFTALFPRLTQLAEAHNDALAQFYHKSCQFMAMVVIPVGVIIAIFARELLPLWVRDPAVVANIHLLVRLLIVGTMLNGLMAIPYALQLAYGWTMLSLVKNVIAVLLLAPLMVWMIDRYGAPGAAVVWIVLNVSYIAIEIPVMHRRLLIGEMWSWYGVDVVLPLAVCVGIGLLARALLPDNSTPSVVVVVVGLAGVAMLLAVGWTLPLLRQTVMHDVLRLRSWLQSAKAR